MLRLTDEEARIVVFPLGIEQRLTRMSELAKLGNITVRSQFLLDELRVLFRGIQYVRNNVIHAVVETAARGESNFYLHSKDRSLPKQQVFSIEEITNYAAHVVWALRLSLGFTDGSTLDYALPYRPDIPEFLQSLIQWPEDQETRARQHRQQS
jgi:hypothetical protein